MNIKKFERRVDNAMRNLYEVHSVEPDEPLQCRLQDISEVINRVSRKPEDDIKWSDIRKVMKTSSRVTTEASKLLNGRRKAEYNDDIMQIIEMMRQLKRKVQVFTEDRMYKPEVRVTKDDVA